MTLIAYLSHPIGPLDGAEDALDNVGNASQWLRFLVERTRWALVCPWLAYVAARIDNKLYSPRALTDQIALLERCDLLVQVGGWRSPHMEIERNHAVRFGIPIIDLIDLGIRPIQNEHIARQLAMREKIAEALQPKRVWMPPLDESDIDALRAAQTVLQSEPFSGDAKALLLRIIYAATRR